MIVGAHVNGGVKGSLARAAEIGADAVQLFVQSPRAWRFPDHHPDDVARFRERREADDLGAVVVHALYLVNLATPDDELYGKSVETLRRTVDTACAIGAGFEAGLERAVPARAQVLERCAGATWLLL